MWSYKNYRMTHSFSQIMSSILFIMHRNVKNPWDYIYHVALFLRVLCGDVPTSTKRKLESVICLTLTGRLKACTIGGYTASWLDPMSCIYHIMFLVIP